jgi:hypothetical protein
MDRTPLIMAVLMAVEAPAAARGEEPSAAANAADTSSIILAPRPLAGVHAPMQDPRSGFQPDSRPNASGALAGLPANGPRSTSSHISSMIAAGLPKYDPFTSAPGAAAGKSPDGGPIGTTPGIMSLPAFIVRDARVPNGDQILTAKGRAEIAMNKYLGPADGLDRGVLNRYTLRQLWQKIPIIGGLPFVGTPVQMSNEQRAFDAAGANDTIPYPHPPAKVKDDSDDLR